jgi:predicted CXXCH cytochrome family protein
VRTDKNRQVQCTSCHDPHNNLYGKFLVRDNTASALCLDCHAPTGWGTSSHATSKAVWNGKGNNPWPHSPGKTVADNGCDNCHASHAAGTKPHLLNFAKAEDNCLSCHNGNVATVNIAAELTKASAHSMSALGSSSDMARGPMSSTDQHIACVDCHPPHAVRAAAVATSASAQVAGSALALSPALGRVKGVTAAGSVVNVATHEYELCFRCHSGRTVAVHGGAPRQFTPANSRLQFSPANASYHPVLAAARNSQDRTLIAPWTTASQLSCTDCHNNDQGPSANGRGPRGPHGSRYAPLLERYLAREDYQFESPAAYALCYKCHSEGILMADRLHAQHVRDQKTACTTCHDAHGVQTQPHLINFNTLYAKPLSGVLVYQDRGAGRSACTLTCHGYDHKALGY